MRDVLFRGKRIDNGEWVEGLLWKKKYGSTKMFISYFPNKDDEQKVCAIEPDTVCQYTGLQDKNDKKIFEGDVCFDENGLTDYYCVIEWVFAGFQLVTYKKASSNARGISNGMNQGYFEDSDGIEVIGNIYDNPELLKEVE